MNTHAVLVATVALALQPGASAQEYHIDRSRENRVMFRSDAPFEDIEGVTDLIDGYVVWRGGTFSDSGDHAGSELYFEVELVGFDTGIGLRNRHMREKYLETDEYPFTSFEASIDRVKATGSRELRITARGTMTLHGVAKEMDASCMVASIEDAYRASCELEILLSDFDIEIPSLVFFKINNAIALGVVFFVIETGKEAEGNP